MFSNSESRYDTSPFITSAPSYLETDPHCEVCDRSLIARFGSELVSVMCESCEADDQRYGEAHNWEIEEG